MFLRFMDGLHHWKFHFPFTFFRKAFFLRGKLWRLIDIANLFFFPSLIIMGPVAWNHWKLDCGDSCTTHDLSVFKEVVVLYILFYWPFCISVQSSMYDSILTCLSISGLEFSSWSIDHYLKNSFFMTSNGTWIRKLTAFGSDRKGAFCIPF